jgi:hypothetical protein
VTPGTLMQVYGFARIYDAGGSIADDEPPDHDMRR